MNVQDWLGKDNELGISIWENKYRQNNESFDGWLDRISNGDSALRRMIIQKKFLFGGRILSNRGLSKQGKKITYSNCYVTSSPEDNLESIFETASKLARTFSYGGGCGVNISRLSPRGAKINNTANETTGAVSFMDLYSNVTGLIGQNGRRGALMIALDCNHPDLEEFIEIKSDLDKVTKANISVMIDDAFMEAVMKKEKHVLKFTRETTGEVIEKEVDADEVFTKLCEMNWDYAEPGVLFWDTVKRHNLLSETPDFEFECTNPCGELPLPAGGSCLLGSINLSEFVTDAKTFDYDDFTMVVRASVIALNDVLDEGLPLHPLQEQRDSVRDWRQIGLGIFGLADMLIKLGIQYGSIDSLELCDRISTVMLNMALIQSSKIAKEKGSFPKYDFENVSKTSFFFENLYEETKARIKEDGLRNSQLLTIAPTGTLSTMLGVSGGIEPIYANYYERTTESLHDKEVKYKVYTPIVKEYMEANNITRDEDLPSYFITSQDLPYENRIDMQATWQRHIDASISSTVNVPNSFTVEDVKNLYIYAWRSRLKGITIFRDGCKRIGILNTDTEVVEPEVVLERGVVLDVNDDVIGKKRKLTTGCGTLHCTAFFDPIDGQLMETYLSKGSTGGCNNFMVGLSRMISLSARAGVDLDTITDQLDSTGACPSYTVRSALKHDVSAGACCPMAIGNALKSMQNEIKDELGIDEQELTMGQKIVKAVEECLVVESIPSQGTPCPNCGESLRFEGGCNSCPSCGWSKCS